MVWRETEAAGKNSIGTARVKDRVGRLQGCLTTTMTGPGLNNQNPDSKIPANGSFHLST